MKDDETLRKFNQEVHSLLEPFQKTGNVRDALAVLAQIIQVELMTNPSYRAGEIIPYTRGLELIMRAVIATLNHEEDTGEVGRHIARKLRSGVSRLAEALEENVSSFVQYEDESQRSGMVRLAALREKNVIGSGRVR